MIFLALAALGAALAAPAIFRMLLAAVRPLLAGQSPDLPAASSIVVNPEALLQTAVWIAAGATALALALALVRRRLLAGRPVHVGGTRGTWDCGYARPTSRMQYTASSFAQMITAMFGWVLRPRVHHPSIDGVFAKPTKMESHIDELILDRVLLPAGRRIAEWFGWFRRFQQGMAQKYVLYILIVVILMLSTLIPFEKFITRLFSR
jgi:hypothetical protein